MVVYDKQVQYTNKSKAFYRKLVELCVKQLYLYETDQLIDPLEDLGFSTIFKQFLNKNGKIINFLMSKKSIISIKKETNIGSAKQEESTKIKKKNINDKQEIKVINFPNSADKSTRLIFDKKETSFMSDIDIEFIEKIIFENKNNIKRTKKNKARINISDTKDSSFISASDIFMNTSFNSAKHLI